MLIIVLFLLINIAGCTPISKGTKEFTCESCHGEAPLKLSHSQLSCKDCHAGSSPAKNKELAHKNLKKDLSPEEVEILCNRCHSKEVMAFQKSYHYTYAGELKGILRGFSLNLKIENIKSLLPLEGSFETKEGLFVDFLKRRCLTCHIYSKGEKYSRTHRAKGCFSCHSPHKLGRPGDHECLSCHYGTKIGWDYYGYSPHPWFVDYRSPFIQGKNPERPYGIEAYRLREDIHKSKGLACVDCHSKQEIMYGEKKISCLSCHKNFKEKNFHQKKILQQVRCEVCHASFISMDDVKVCYLEINPNLEEWIDLSIQESSEIEEIIGKFMEGKRVSIKMKDKFTDKEKEGLWLCTLGNRTFDKIFLGKDKEGRLCLLRKEKLTLIHENIEITGIFETCKTSHSIGKGDINRAFSVLKELK